jgi:hypothetical protein
MDTSNAFEVVRLDQELRRKEISAHIFELRRACFPEIVGTAYDTREYWSWKHGEFAWPSWVSCSRESTEVVGFYGTIPLKYQSRAGSIDVGLVCDVMTSPSFQGMGIFSSLGRVATSESLDSTYHLLLGYPIRKNVMPGHKKVGWTFTEKMPVFVTIRSRLFNQISRIISRDLGISTSVCDPLSLFSQPNFKKFNEVWQQSASEEGLFFLDLDPNFLQWRYSAPGVQYVAVVAKDKDNEVVGYLIARRMKTQNLSFIAIGDIRVRNSKVSHQLLSALSNHYKGKGLIIAGMFSRQVLRSTGLRKCGFIRTTKRFTLIQMTKSGQAREAKHAYLTWSDTDDI